MTNNVFLIGTLKIIILIFNCPHCGGWDCEWVFVILLLEPFVGLNFFQTLIARHPQDKFSATVPMSFFQLVSHVQMKIPCW